MPYVEPTDLANAPADAKEILEAIKEKYGKVLNIFGTMAHQPDVLKGIATVNDGVEQDLPPKLRELAYYHASQVNGCAYCSHYHRQGAKSAGVSVEQLDAVAMHATSELFDETEKAVLSYAESLTKTAAVSDAQVSAVKEHLNDTQLVTLAATVALANFTNRFNHGLDVELP